MNPSQPQTRNPQDNVATDLQTPGNALQQTGGQVLGSTEATLGSQQALGGPRITSVQSGRVTTPVSVATTGKTAATQYATHGFPWAGVSLVLLVVAVALVVASWRMTPEPAKVEDNKKKKR
jgi:cobalamin biosynthesis Mg chelatase CobN